MFCRWIASCYEPPRESLHCWAAAVLMLACFCCGCGLLISNIVWLSL